MRTLAIAVLLLTRTVAAAVPVAPTWAGGRTGGLGQARLSIYSVELPPPTPGLTLKQIGVGRGTQNYTCAGPGAAPVAKGASATIYNISPLPQAAFNPLTRLAASWDAASFTRLNLAVLGRHFHAAGVTALDLGAKGYLAAAKQAGVSAPSRSMGSYGTGADWLKWEADGSSFGVLEAYRVETVGGGAPSTCVGGGTMLEQYAAQYWFYGP